MDGDLITVRLGGVDRQVFVTYWERHAGGGEETIRLVGRILPNVTAGTVASATVSNPPDDLFYIPDGQTLENHPPLPEGYRLLRVSERNLKNQPKGVLLFWIVPLRWASTSESESCRHIWYAIRISNSEPPIATTPDPKKRKRPLEM